MGGNIVAKKECSPEEFLNKRETIEIKSEEQVEELKDIRSIEKLHLHFQCENVKDICVGYEPDTLLTVEEKKGENWELIGSTEIAVNELNPKYVKSICVNYYYQEIQKFRANIYEIIPKEDNSKEKSENSFLCSAEFQLSNFFTAKNNVLALSLENEKTKSGLLKIIYEAREIPKKTKNIDADVQISPCADFSYDYYFKIFRPINTARAIEKMSLILKEQETSRSELALRCKETESNTAEKKMEPENPESHKENESEKVPDTTNSEQIIIVYRSRFGKKNEELKNYAWEHFRAQAKDLILDDMSKPLIIEVGIKKQEKMYQTPQKLFEKIITMAEIQANGISWPLTNDSIYLGNFKMEGVTINEEYRFLDYFRAGASLKLAVSIDFTLSNKYHEKGKKPEKIEDFDTAHNYEDFERNPYTVLIRAIGKPILGYDNEKKILALGFGAKLPKIGRSFCFALSGNIFDPEITGLTPMLQLYTYVLKKVTMSGPTFLAEVINYHAEVVELYTTQSTEQNLKYYTHLIIVDGTVTDIEECKDAIVRASDLPISIVIIGVHDILCKNMHDIFNPDYPITSKKLDKMASRTMTQYYTFDIRKDNPEKLANTVIREIEKQYSEYINIKKIYPMSIKKSENKESEIKAENPGTSKSETSPYTELLNKFKSEYLEAKRKEKEEAEKRAEIEKGLDKKQKSETEKEKEHELVSSSTSNSNALRLIAKEESKIELEHNPNESPISHRAKEETKLKEDAKSEEQKKEESKEEEEEFERFEKIMAEGIPMRNLFNFRQLLRKKDFVNEMLPDDAKKKTP